LLKTGQTVGLSTDSVCVAAPSEEPAPEPVPEPAPAYLRLLMETDWRQFCLELEAFKQAAASLIANGTAM
jgi:hypothetical protein